MTSRWNPLTLSLACLLSIGALLNAQSVREHHPQQDAPVAGSVADLLKIAHEYYYGVNGHPDYEMALKFFREASQEGSAEAKAWLGYMSLRGYGTVQSLESGSTLIRESAQSNDPVGLRFMGLIYQDGLGVAQNYTQARQSYQKAVALNDANSCGRLGMMYLLGLGGLPDKSHAIELLTEGAKLGDVWAQEELGDVYLSVSDEGATRPRHTIGPSNIVVPSASTLNYPMALKYFSQASAGGSNLATFRLGQMYEHGLGVPQSYSQAFKYYQRAALRGFIAAQFNLGRLYEQGLGTDLSYIKAYVFYSLASQKGNIAAGNYLESLSRSMTAEQRSESEAMLALVQQQQFASDRADSN
jgi:uncharacterized protein